MSLAVKRINLISKISGEWWLIHISILYIILLLVVSGKYLIIKNVLKVRKNGMTI